MVTSRLSLAKREDVKKSEKQIEIEEIMEDEVATPILKNRKVHVIEQQYRQRELENRKLKDAQKQQELDDAITGKR